jgi:mannose-1-phosphate guanylyltransferase/mannose-1-phosphate guanylyltransferase/mannose-6-phosphate isomerase
LSRLGRPKQMVAIGGDRSLLQRTVERVADPAVFAPPILVTGETEAKAVAAQLAAIGAAPDATILEPAPRGTAAAIALAALETGGDSVLLVLPSDHEIADPAAFGAALAAALPFAAEGRLVTFGIRPDRPETGYGWIRRGAALGGGLFEAAAFVEKPDRASAERLLAEGGHDWNAGIFLFRADALLAALALHAPAILDAARAASRGAARADGIVRPAADALAASHSLSIDKAVMEKAENVAVMPVEMGWSDIGSWDAIHALGPHDSDGNALSGDVVAPDSRNCLVRSDGPTIVALGVQDLVIVATERAVLIVPRGESQRVQEALAALEARRDSPPATKK